jgi:2-polyprenyl-3-methyl-5-hydroxy-6-metoxy-1,4-benzoquinol methylase
VSSNADKEKVREATSFFNANADAWDKSAKATDMNYSGIRDRHDVVHAVLDGRIRTRRMLDLGCGTGQLAIEMAARGIESVGIDVAQRMVEIARDNAKSARSPANFFHADVLGDLCHFGKFDLVSAQGLIECSPLGKLDHFFSMCGQLLEENGSLVIGSRNRLFNAVSLNAYTRLEQELGMLQHLLAESLEIVEAESQDQLVRILRNLRRIWNYPTVTPPTGIDVMERLQFTPSDLVARLEMTAVRVVNLFPVHYQSVIPVSRAGPDLARESGRLANLVMLRERATYCLIPWSSSFIVHASR